MPRLDEDKQQKFEHMRMKYAINELNKLGYIVCIDGTTTLHFIHNKNRIVIYTYSGYFNGKGVKAGRGIDELLKQLK